MTEITLDRKLKLMWRWSLVSGAAIFIFWFIYYLITGSVPEVGSIKITKTLTYGLPFPVSRWWDVLIGPIWSSVLVLLSTSSKIKEDDDLFLTAGLAAGLGFGLAAGLGFGLAVGLVVSLTVGLVVSLTVGLVVSLTVGLAAAIKVIAGIIAKRKKIGQDLRNWLLAR